MDPSSRFIEVQPWWRPRRMFSLAELIVDGAVHVVGLCAALSIGSILLTLAALRTAPAEFPAIALYLSTLVGALGISLAFNLAPVSRLKKLLARLDQAAIFLLIAGTYTPFLAIVGGTPTGQFLTILVWSASLVGVALKLIVPQRFGRLAIVLYLAIGWSGVLSFQALATLLPTTALWLILIGGVTYSFGIVFHLWDRLKFNNVLWHVFVVAGATCHLWAVFDCMVLSRW